MMIVILWIKWNFPLNSSHFTHRHQTNKNSYHHIKSYDSLVVQLLTLNVLATPTISSPPTTTTAVKVESMICILTTNIGKSSRDLAETVKSQNKVAPFIALWFYDGNNHLTPDSLLSTGRPCCTRTIRLSCLLLKGHKIIGNTWR